MLTRATTLQRNALLNLIICREGEYFLLFSKKFRTIAFPECALTVALRVINTTTDSERVLISRLAFIQCSWSYLKFIYPAAASCMMRFSLATASQFMVAQ